MTTVILTGTAAPLPGSRRAGPGVLVRHGDIALQFDAGRATVLRLAEAGVVPSALTAVFLTHVHRDHVLDLLDLAMTRWLFRNLLPSGPLPVVAAVGEAADVVARMAHLEARPPEVALSTFTAAKELAVVWHSADPAVTVRAVAVHGEPVKNAVAYRVDTPDAAVVISGDTQMCAEIEELARGADLLVHETCRATALDGAVREQEEKRFEEDLRSGGYTGRITAGHDLMDFPLPWGGDGACI